MSGPNLQTTPSNYSHSFKAYGISPTPGYEFKGLGSGASSGLAADQARWYKNEFYPYYLKVISGEVTPGPEWQEVLASAEWLLQQNPSLAASGGINTGTEPWGAAPQNTNNDAGGTMGLDGAWTYDTSETDLRYVPDGSTHHSFAYENTLVVDSTSAKVTKEVTLHGNPPVQVLKVTVKSATGESTYIYENWQSPDFKLKIKVPSTSQVSGDSFDHVTVSKLSSNEGSDKPAASIEGETQDDGSTKYVAESMDQVIEFNPQGDETEVNFVTGNAKINVPLDGEVNVVKSDIPGYDYAVMTTVDGVTHTYYVKKDFLTNLSALPSTVSFDLDGDDVADSVTEGEVPPELDGIITLNGKETEAETKPISTAPDRVQEGVAFYNTSDDVEIYAYSNDDLVGGWITAPGTVTIHVSSYEDDVEITRVGENYQVRVYRDGVHDMAHVEIYNIDPGIKNIVVDALPSHISGDAMEDPKIQIMSGGEVMANSSADVEWPGEDLLDEVTRQYDADNEAGNHEKWGDMDDSDTTQEFKDSKALSRQLVLLMSTAIRSGNWSEVRSFLRDSNIDYVDDALRSVVKGLENIAGGDETIFGQLMDQIPEEVRQVMITKLSSNLDEDSIHVGLTGADAVMKITNTLDGADSEDSDLDDSDLGGDEE